MPAGVFALNFFGGEQALKLKNPTSAHGSKNAYERKERKEKNIENLFTRPNGYSLEYKLVDFCANETLRVWHYLGLWQRLFAVVFYIIFTGCEGVSCFNGRINMQQI